MDGGATISQCGEAIGSRLDQLDRVARLDEPDGGRQTDVAGTDDGDASSGGFHRDRVASLRSGRPSRGISIESRTGARTGASGLPC